MKYYNEYVCLFVCLHNSKTTWPNFTKFFMHGAYGRDLILWWRCNTLYTSGFVDDFVFHTVWPMGRIKHDVMFGSTSCKSRLDYCICPAETCSRPNPPWKPTGYKIKMKENGEICSYVKHCQSLTCRLLSESCE